MRKTHRHKRSMPKRPLQHELDTEAIDFIKSRLPTGWTRDDIQHDYGKDLRIEIFESGEATGLEFYIQAKGHERFEIRHGDQVIQSLEVSKLNLYDLSVLPVLLVVYSAEEKVACYLWMQSYIRDVLDKEEPGWRDRAGHSTITVRVPRAQRLDRSVANTLLQHVEADAARIRSAGTGSFESIGRQDANATQLVPSSRFIHPQIESYLKRPRLTGLIESVLASRAAFICAEAGYGKTWLVQDYINSSHYSHVVWYTFSKDYVDFNHFIRGLAAELLRHSKTVGDRTLRYVTTHERDLTPEAAAATLIEEIRTTPKFSGLLILEDLHNVADARIMSFVEALLLPGIEPLRLILTSRLPLPFGHSRLISQGRLRVIERQDMEFSHEEIIDYVRTVVQVDLSDDKISQLHRRTGGWIAPIGLAMQALQKSPSEVDQVFARLTGFAGSVYDFFAEEVYTALPPETRFILKRLSLVRSIQPEVVDLFTGRKDGGQVLRDLSRHNTFLLEDQSERGRYRLHALFAEFLATRFADEEGQGSVKDAQRALASFYAGHRNWYAAIEHALSGEDYGLANRGLEVVGPLGLSMGHGGLLLQWVERIPSVERPKSAKFAELVGIAALQVGKLDLADEQLLQARTRSEQDRDPATMRRLDYFIAEAKLGKAEISGEEFVHIVGEVVEDSYENQEILFGVQTELRLIQVGQTISGTHKGLLPVLLKRCQRLLGRIGALGNDYNLMRARLLATQAHLDFQVADFGFLESASKAQIREKIGHPLPLTERVGEAKRVIDGFHSVFDRYRESEKLVKDDNELEWASIHIRHLEDYAHFQVITIVMRASGEGKSPTEALASDTMTVQFLQQTLADFERCAEIFQKYEMMQLLADLLCEGAEIYDILQDANNRDRLARQALELATERGFAEVIQRSQRILRNENTYSSLLGDVAKYGRDDYFANLTGPEKGHFVDSMLASLPGGLEDQERRRAVAADVDDMVAASKQRLTWCKHVEIIQDLTHTKSLATMYKGIPAKRITCVQLGHQSPASGRSFDELWPTFKGGYCLGCVYRET